MGRMGRFWGILVVWGIVCAAAVGAWGWWSLDQAIGGDKAEVVEVKKGAGLKGVLFDLQARGLLRHPRVVYVYARLARQTHIHVGFYDVSATMTPRAILHMLQEGRVKLGSVTLVEGSNRWQVRQILVAGEWMSPATFDGLCDDDIFLRRHEIAGPTCEGYLFPETYTFARGIAPEKIFAAMFSMYRRNYDAVVSTGRGPLELAERQFVTLASIVEKETGAQEERQHIACVFYNRLQAKPAWRLETDPTVIYAATLADPLFDGNIKRTHLRKLDSPYNTYRQYGLPPGPIANPGRAALAAVAQPKQCDDFFFVSMNNGKHRFCRNMACHQRAVQEWQIEYFRKKRRRAR